MKAVVQDDGAGSLEVLELPPPLLQTGGVLVQTAVSVISAGTERTTRELARKSLVGKALARPDEVRKIFQVAQVEGVQAARQRVSARLSSSRPLGYSSAGRVIAVGADAADCFSIGQFVACAGGGYANHAELVYVPKNLCVPVPEGVDLESAAFTTLGAIALQGVRQADARVGEVVAVVGLGVIGQLTAQVLRAAGCTVIGIDLDAGRCDLAKRLGADRALLRSSDTASRVVALAPSGVDAVLLTAATKSNDPVELAADICRDRARVVAVGAVELRVPREPFYKKELELRLSRSYGPGRYDSTFEEEGVDYPIGYVRWTETRNMRAFLELVRKGAVRPGPLVSHRYPLERATEAYDVVEGRAGQSSLGVVFTYANGDVVAPARVQLVATRSRPAPSAAPGVGLIGAGRFASGILLPALRSVSNGRLQFRGIASASGISARAVGRRFGFQFCASDAREILADPAVTAVIITTRHDQHAALVEAALLAGKTVFVEKPLALSRAELARVVVAQTAAQQPVLVGFNRRFAPLTRAVRAHFADTTEPLAVIARVNAGFLPRSHWTQSPTEGGGRILGEACHFVDLMCHLVGGAPVEVHAHALTNAPRYSGDNIAATIHFSDGSVGTLLYFANGDTSLAKERIEVFGQGRSAVIDDFREARLYADGRSHTVRLRAQDKGHAAEMTAFVDLLLSGGPPAVVFDESVISTLTTIAIQDSLNVGTRVPVHREYLGD
jgi:predicted dehydrogenase/threonine dehydrogenase-like Zn-dependent dehydrogenase